MDDFWFEFIEITQSVGDGFLFGSTYALIGIGFTLIFGAMGKLNIAYAATAMAGAYSSLAIFIFFDAPLIFSQFQQPVRQYWVTSYTLPAFVLSQSIII